MYYALGIKTSQAICSNHCAFSPYEKYYYGYFNVFLINICINMENTDILLYDLYY